MYYMRELDLQNKRNEVCLFPPSAYNLRGNERRAADGSEHQGTKGVLLQAEEWSTEDPWPYVHAIPSQLMISQG